MKTEKDLAIKNKPSIQGVTGDRKRERLLELSLPALVKLKTKLFLRKPKKKLNS